VEQHKKVTKKNEGLLLSSTLKKTTSNEIPNHGFGNYFLGDWRGTKGKKHMTAS